MSYLYGGDSDDEDGFVMGGNHWDNRLHTVPDENVPEESTESKMFKESIINAKKNIYDSNIFSIDEDSDKAHSIELLKEYRKDLHNFYIYSVKLQDPVNHSQQLDLSIFPEKARDSIQLALNIIKTEFTKKSISETIPYSDFIKNLLYVHPYVQRNMDDDDDKDGKEDEGYFSG